MMKGIQEFPSQNNKFNLCSPRVFWFVPSPPDPMELDIAGKHKSSAVFLF